jgi:hypothetical protein
LPQTLRKVVPGYAKREIDKKMDAGKFGKTDADKDANFQRYKKIQDKLKEQGVAEAGEWTKLPNGNWRNMHTGAQQSTPPKTKKPRRTMGLHASLEQHADDKMKELGHKFKPVDEARVGNRMSDISVGSPKIVHYKGKAVGEVGIDHDPSPGNGPYYFHHYLTGKAYVGYDTKQQALADLKSIVMQVDDKELEEEKQRLDPKCWTGYKKQGTKMKGGVRVNNCVPVNEAEFTEDKLAQDLYRDLQIFKKGADKDIGQKAKSKDLSSKAKDKDIVAKEDWQKVNKGDKTDGMSSKAVKAYRRENPGSKLKTAVTTKPSKLKAGSKDAKRRKSFCARMSGVEGPMKDEHGKPTPKAKALKRWNC